jgi:PAS domain S-box-containing protein
VAKSQKRRTDPKITDEGHQQEIDERRHAEEELQRSHVLLNAINEAQSHFITDSEEWILFDGLLKNLLLLTKSEYGFIGEILFNPTGEPYLKTKAITNIAWNDETREFYKKNAPVGMEFYNTKTLFGQVMITGKPVIANNPSMDERRGGVPPGHPPLFSFLGVPFYQGKKLVGMAGVANCPGGYKEDLVEYLKPLLTTGANIIKAYRNENQRKRAEEELVHRARLAELGNEIGVALSHEVSLQNILQRCTESIVKNLDAALARIWTYNQRDEVLELQASAGIYTHINGDHSRIPIGKYKIGRIAKNRKPHLINSVIGDPEVHDQEWACQEKMVSFAGYPLIIEDKLVGVLAMFSRQPLTDFSLKSISSVADNIANGIERKKAEKEKERYIEAINKATDGITIADEIDRYIYVNSAYANIFGYSQDELMGETWRKITPPEIISSVEKGIPHTMHNKNVGVFNGEVPSLRKDGTILPTEVTGTGFWDEDGRYRGHVCIVRDITERKQADEKMKQSEEKYRDLFQNANDAICILDSDLKYKDVNKKTVEMFGYTREELLNMSVRDLIPSDQLPKSEIEFNKLKIKGSYEKFVGKARTKDGQLIDVEVSSSVIKKGSKVIGSRDIIRDITERKQSEEALLESKKNLQEAQRLAHIGSWQWTVATDTVKWSDELYHINGIDPNSSPPGFKELSSFYTPESWNRLSAVVAEALRSGKSYELDLEMMRPDGTIIHTSSRGEADYDASGKIVGLHGTVQDISERKQVEDMIKESETMVQSILDNSSTVVFLKDNQGRYITVNRRYEELFHVNRNEVVNKTDYDIFPREYADKFRMHDEQALEKLCAIEMEEVVPHDDGLHTYISVKFPLSSPDGKPYAVCGIATDITERKKAQEQIEKSLKEKEVLLREVYHRVKNNMQIITSLLNLQSRYARDGEYREMFRESHNRIKSMSLVHEKLYQSKDLSTIDFKEYINDIAKGLFLSYGANKSKIALIMDINNISIDINTAIPCGLIINELVTNSLKHAFPDGKEGEIKIAIHSTNENTIELVVGDNGIGISEDVDFKTTESLGLQLVTMLSENQLHGEIILDRSKGTEFTIKFKEVK